jgi:SnoaL-like domain
MDLPLPEGISTLARLLGDAGAIMLRPVHAMETVERWDRSLREGDWQSARALLSEDAPYTAPDFPDAVDCDSPDAIIAFLSSLKGEVPDVQVVEWEAEGDRVIARLRQPAFGDDSDWYQVLEVRDAKIARMTDFPSREAALAAAS